MEMSTPAVDDLISAVDLWIGCVEVIIISVFRRQYQDIVVSLLQHGQAQLLLHSWRTRANDNQYRESRYMVRNWSSSSSSSMAIWDWQALLVWHFEMQGYYYGNTVSIFRREDTTGRQSEMPLDHNKSAGFHVPFTMSIGCKHGCTAIINTHLSCYISSNPESSSYLMCFVEISRENQMPEAAF